MKQYVLSGCIPSLLQLHLNSETDNPHHEARETRVKRDAEMVNHVMAAIAINPFRITSEHIINM